jgi:hypothetical protein
MGDAENAGFPAKPPITISQRASAKCKSDKDAMDLRDQGSPWFNRFSSHPTA